MILAIQGRTNKTNLVAGVNIRQTELRRVLKTAKQSTTTEASEEAA